MLVEVFGPSRSKVDNQVIWPGPHAWTVSGPGELAGRFPCDSRMQEKRGTGIGR
jgi:hypothetical protein